MTSLYSLKELTAGSLIMLLLQITIIVMYNLEQIKQTIIANGSITSSDIPDLRKIV